uniref:ATP synthase complex subunit 8 n=1 Tax=Calappa bilineata TaxID=405176 RepID=A0A6G8J0D5_9EUCA|nr:ATP synthase F0 subunit 8 [Calappa bilineata]QIM59221.1 ATP synthase F0 subunit 8 [Calappa bilineata]
MPQMAPLMWLYLFFFFLVIMFMFIALNFFIKPFESTPQYIEPYKSDKNHWKL